MRLSTLIVSAAALAAISATAPIAAASAATQSSVAQSARTMTPTDDGQLGGESIGVNGLDGQSEVCAALGAETIPTGGEVAKCLVGTHLI
jgi:hypothetical protein